MKLNNSEQEIVILGRSFHLKGILGRPPGAKAVVVFAHGSGSGRLSSRNNFVARELQKAGFATLLMDLLTEDEEADRKNVFDIHLLSERLLLAKNWVAANTSALSLVGYFGASTGAAAALEAAAKDPANIFAVVSRGGRPDLAMSSLPQVKAPTLLIVGGRDDVVIELNQKALRQLTCAKELTIIPGATHLFEEPGALEQVAQKAAHWFVSHVEVVWIR